MELKTNGKGFFLLHTIVLHPYSKLKVIFIIRRIDLLRIGGFNT